MSQSRLPYKLPSDLSGWISLISYLIFVAIFITFIGYIIKYVLYKNKTKLPNWLSYLALSEEKLLKQLEDNKICLERYRETLVHLRKDLDLQLVNVKKFEKLNKSKSGFHFTELDLFVLEERMEEARHWQLVNTFRDRFLQEQQEGNKLLYLELISLLPKYQESMARLSPDEKVRKSQLARLRIFWIDKTRQILQKHDELQKERVTKLEQEFEKAQKGSSKKF